MKSPKASRTTRIVSSRRPREDTTGGGVVVAFIGAGIIAGKMKKIRAAVVGVGYLGRFQPQKYAAADSCELVGVVDARPEAREKVAGELNTQAFADYHELIGRVDAVSVATTT